MSDDRTVVWEAELPLVSGAVIRQWTMAMLATGAVTLFILAIALGAQGEWEGLRGLVAIIAAVVGGLWLFGLVVMVVLFRGRYRTRYTLSDRGILCEGLESSARAVNRLAVGAGLLTGKPGLLGAGILARSREAEEVRWKGAFRAVARPEAHLVALRNRWRTVMLVQCTPENFDAVAGRIAEEMNAHGTDARVAGRSPLPFYVVHSVLIGLASASLVLLAGEYDLDLFVPILVLCFALATLWLVNLFGYVVLAGVVFLALSLVLELTDLHQSTLFPGRTWRAYELLDPDEIGLLLLAALGAGYLVWLSLRAVRGGFLALLVRDYDDMEGG